MLQQVRRIVTTNDADGKSGVMSDGVANERHHRSDRVVDHRPRPVNHTDGIDHGALSTRLEPPKGGTLFRYFQIAPEIRNRPSLARGAHPTQRRMVRRHAGRPSPAGHRSPSCHAPVQHDRLHHSSERRDHAPARQGGARLKPFDVVVQRGTNHAWVNRGPGCTVNGGSRRRRTLRRLIPRTRWVRVMAGACSARPAPADRTPAPDRPSRARLPGIFPPRCRSRVPPRGPHRDRPAPRSRPPRARGLGCRR